MTAQPGGFKSGAPVLVTTASGDTAVGILGDHTEEGLELVDLLELRFVHTPDGVATEVTGEGKRVLVSRMDIEPLIHVPGCADCPAGPTGRGACIRGLEDEVFRWRAARIGIRVGGQGVQSSAPDEGVASDPLTDWWVNLAKSEVGPLVAKAVEYGGAGRALDLIDVGRDMLRMQGIPDGEITDEWATEAGIYFYLRGKFSRWMAAMLEKRRVSDDTLHDIGVYVRMAQRAREVGGWPV